MPICVVVFKQMNDAFELEAQLQNNSESLFKSQLIKPNSSNGKDFQENDINAKEATNLIKTVDIDSVRLLSPKLARKLRQKAMAFWLMPFGFVTGLAFTKMTGLKTFANFGLDPITEPLIGSFLGMGSGLLGSYFAAASINPDKNDDIRSLRKLNKEGLWLMIVETPFEIELPWSLLKESKHQKIMELNKI